MSFFICLLLVNQHLIFFFNKGFLPLELDLENAVRHTSAEIIRPQPNVDKPLKFKSDIRVNLDVEANIYNSSDIYDIAIEVSYYPY